jgi:archaellum component FlaC
MATPEIMEQFAIRSAEYAQIHRSEIQQVLKSQRTLESEIIQRTNSFCPLAQIKDRTVRAEDIERALSEGFGDANVLRTLMCMNNSILSYSPNDAGRGFKVRHYLENLTQIGGESAEGYAAVADVNSGSNSPSGKNLFVTKAPRKIDENFRSNQTHEYFVGAFGTNSLRNKIPNFAFMMGFFKCSPPYIDNSSYAFNGTNNERKALTYCQNDVDGNQVNYLIYENVSNSVTLQSFIEKGCTFQQFLNVFIQIILALDLAYTELDFTHYDLHTENVLVRELPEEILICYRSDGMQKYLKTKYVATIIDYGRSHIKFEGKDFGDAFFEAGTYPNLSYPMNDIYKLLMFSLNASAFGNKDMRNYAGLSDQEIKFANADVFQNAKELISYFNPDVIRNNMTNSLINAADYVIESRKFYYQLPYSPQFNIRPLKFFQDIIMTIYPGFIKKIFKDNVLDSDPVYGCANKGTCYSLEQAISEYSKPTINYIDDAYTFYEMVRSQQINLQTIISEGEKRYEAYMVQLRNDKNKFINQYNQVTQGYNIINLQTGAPDDLKFQNEFLEFYRRFIAKSVKLVDLLTSIGQIEMVIKMLNELYPNKSQQIVPGTNYRYIDISQEEFDIIRESVGGMNQVISSIKQDVVYISTLNEREIIRLNYDAIWLFQKMPSLVATITQL